MAIFGDIILEEIEEIIDLAGDIHKRLKKHDIKKARKELNSLIRLDLDEIKRIKSELGDQQLIRECYIVLNDAKQIMKNVNFSKGCLKDSKGKSIGFKKEGEELLDRIKRLIDHIITIEQTCIIELKEDRKKLKRIKEAWEENADYRVVYHGTSSVALKKIKRYGLVPGMKIYDLRELQILVELMKQAGLKNPVGPWFKPLKKRIFYTVHKDAAEDYAKRSPEFWQQLITPNFAHYNASENYEEALRTICSKLCGQNNRLEKVSKNKLIDYVKKNSRIEPKEINLGLGIFKRLWDIFGDSEHVIIHVSIKAPALSKTYYTYSFEHFLKWFSIYLNLNEHFPKKSANYLLIPIERIKEKVDNFYDDLLGEMGEFDSYVEERIPAKYILKYET